MKQLGILLIIAMAFMTGCQTTTEDVEIGDYYGLTPIESETVAAEVVEKITEGKLARDTTFAIDKGNDSTVGYFIHRMLTDKGYAIKSVKNASKNDIITYWYVHPIGEVDKTATLYLRVISGKDDWSRRYESHNGKVIATSPFSKGEWE